MFFAKQLASWFFVVPGIPGKFSFLRNWAAFVSASFSVDGLADMHVKGLIHTYDL